MECNKHNSNRVESLDEECKQKDISGRRLTQGCTRLMYACQQGQTGVIVKELRTKPGVVRHRDRSNKSALHYCSDQKNLVAAASVAVAAPELLESADEDGFTPLHLAVIQGNMAMVNLLLANKADVNALDHEGHSVVHWATVCGEVEALRTVLMAGANVATPDINGGSPLHYAAQMCGANYDGKLGQTSSKLSLDILGILLSHPKSSVDVTDKDGRQPLLWAASAGSAKAVIALVKAGARVESADKDGLTALHCAASRGHTECIDTLISLCGAPTDLIDSNGCTALHYAVTLGHADATSRLLDLEADPNRQDRKGRTPAHCGCSKGQFETLKLLKEGGANLWLRNAKGDLPVHEAASSGRRELVEWLLEQRPKQVNITSNDGRSLLHIASGNDYTDMCKMLLDFGADINCIYRNSKGVVMTPLDCALQKGYRSTAKFLQSNAGLPVSKLRLSAIRPNAFNEQELVRPMKYIDKPDIPDKHSSKNYTVYLKKPGSGSSECSCEEHTIGKHEKRVYECHHHRKRARRRASSCSDTHEPTKDDEYFEVSRSKSNMEIRRRKSREHVHSTDEEDSCANCCHHRQKLRQRRKIRKSRDYVSVNVTEATEKIPINIHSSDNKNAIAYKARNQLSFASPDDECAPKLTIAEFESNNNALSRSVDESQRTAEMTAELPIGLERVNEENMRYLNKIAATTDMADIEAEPKLSSDVNVVPENVDCIETKIATSSMDTSGDQKEVQSRPSSSTRKRPQSAKKKYQKQGTFIKSSSGERNYTTTNAPLDLTDEEEIPKAEKVIITAEIHKSDEVEVAHEVQQTPNEPVECAEESVLSEVATEVGSVLKDDQADVQSIQEALNNEAVSDNKQNAASESIEISQTNDTIVNNEEDVNQELPVEKVDSSQVQSEPEKHDTVMKELEAVSCDKADEEDKLETSLEVAADDFVNESVETVVAISENTTETVETGANEKEAITEAVIRTELNEPSSTVIEDNKITDTATTTTEKETKDTKVAAEDETKKAMRYAGKRKKLKETTETADSTDIKGTGVEGRRSFTLISDSQDVENNVRKSSFTILKSDESVDVEEDDEDADHFIAEQLQSFQVVRESSIKPLPTLGQPYTSEEEDVGADVEEEEPAPTKERMKSAERFTQRSKPSSLQDQNGRKKRLKRRVKTAEKQSIWTKDPGQQTSKDQDSGFEPSPRAFKTKIPSPRSVHTAVLPRRPIYATLDNRSCSSRVENRKLGDRNACNMTAVTRSIQRNIRRYYMERKLFQHLLELKSLQIRSSKLNESVLVKRAVDDYHKSCLALGAETGGTLRRYMYSEYTFKNFEMFLYETLKSLQKAGTYNFKNINEVYEEAERRLSPDYNAYEKALQCTTKTHRCLHAAHAYTGIPCAAYIPMMNHHTIPKFGFGPYKKTGVGSFYLPKILTSHSRSGSRVSLELSHGKNKQLISLPSDKLDSNKRYYVTFTVKGTEADGKSTQQDAVHESGDKK